GRPVARGRVGNARNRQVGVGDAAVDVLVLLPEPPFELQPHLDRRAIGYGIDGGLHLGAYLDVDLTQDRQRDSAQAPIGLFLLQRAAAGLVRERYGHATLVLFDADDARLVADEVADLPGEGLGDHVHAAHRLEHGALELIGLAGGDSAPQPGLQQLAEFERPGWLRRRHQASAGIDLVAAPGAGGDALAVAKLGIERAPAAQAFEQLLLVFLCQHGIEAALARGLAQQFRHMPLEIGLHMAVALRLAPIGRARVNPGVVIDLHKGFECDAKLPAVVKHGMVVVGDAPGTGVEVLALGEAAVLHAAAQLGEGVATAYRPAASTGTLVVFQDRDLVAGIAQFERRNHAGQAGAENQHAAALFRA